MCIYAGMYAYFTVIIKEKEATSLRWSKGEWKGLEEEKVREEMM